MNNRLVAGKYTLHNENNDNGLRLCQFAEMNHLLISSTIYVYKKIHKGTWNDPANKIVNWIDHILICKRRVSTLQDVRTLREPNCDQSFSSKSDYKTEDNNKLWKETTETKMGYK